ncbi:ammonia permease [Lamprobacter modestohalophilus]|uniref:Ammonia permease n=1 Tax=Lamprobacter modestohalophilus TaxID=1064514 RepID=A0A9X0W789_9GAMM|nr:ammonium transporter [Lamprobacter modestohalophilus]MBK1618278.1 ammonia permease [Lamprobacter modestohalophilus]
MDEIARIDILWVLLSSVLVLLMQGGFLCLESGLTRSKNAINVALKNASDFLIATLVWYLVGFGLMFGDSGHGWIGSDRFVPDLSASDPWDATFFIFQLMFCATAATIVSGAVAERMRFRGYHLVTLITVALIYPLFGHWAWGGALGGESGWLATLGFVDFAGSTVVHSVGGWIALAAVLVIGPRAGRFGEGEPLLIPGSNLPLAMLGVLFFLVGWVGFNGGSTLALDTAVPGIIVNTLMSAAAGGVAAYLLTRWLAFPGLDRVAVPMNGVIAGLVAITAGCHVVATWEAILIGALAGLLVVFATELLARMQIDDAIGAIPVHLVAGIWGTLAVALFGAPALIGTGLSMTEQLAVQAFGIVIAGAWAFLVSYLLLRLINAVFRLRVTAADEEVGLNVAEHGAKTELVDLMTALKRQERSTDLSLRVPVEPFTEVGQIASQHNRLMDALEQAVTRSQAIVRDLRDGILTFSDAGLLTSLNPGAEKILAVAGEAAVGTAFVDLFECESQFISGGLDAQQSNADWCRDPAELVSEGKVEVALKRREAGRPVFVELAVTEDSRSQGSYTCLMRDVSDRRRVEEQLFEEKELAQTTLEAIADGVITTDRGGRVLYMNAIAAKLTGWPVETANGQPLYRVFPVVDSPTEMPTDWITRRVLRDGETLVESKSRLLYCRDGNVHVVQLTAAPIRDAEGHLRGLVVVFHDKTQERAMERQLTYQAKHDALTGLINRREFEHRLTELIEQLEDGPAQHLLCYIDLDQFKLVNDVCGHAAGDALLRQVANLLQRGLRSADTLARLGGDEFGVLLTNCPIERGTEIAETMRERVHALRFAWEDKLFAIGASVGLVPLSRSLGNLADALSRADAACYAAKDGGRNRVHLYDPDDQELSLRKGQMNWVSRIQRAIDEDGFQLFYQGIAPVKRPEEINSHFEILLRLTGDGDEVMPPGAFIPAAERYGLMPDVDYWVVNRTLQWLSAYQARGGAEIKRCAINLSGATLGNDKHTARIRDCLTRYRIDPRLICFEITETSTMANVDQAKRFITEVKQLGCRFALDDFGSGLSSFGYLRDLDVDLVKIDGSFIRDLDSNAIHRAMVEAIVGIAGVMGLGSIAEFVENARVVEVLREIGVDYAQGFHLARPRPLTEYPLPPS